MKKLFIFQLVAVLFFVSCQQQTQNADDNLPANHLKGNNIKRTFRANGTLVSEITINKGKYDGIARNYFENGKVSHEFIYINGKKEGTGKLYYTSGKLNTLIHYVKGKKNGPMIRYYKNGKVAAEIPYENDYPQPGLKEYTKEGKQIDYKTAIVVKTINRIATDNKYIIQLSTTDKARNVRFFKLMKTSEGLKRQIIPTQNGVGTITYHLSPGKRVYEQAFLEAQVETLYGNPYVVRKVHSFRINSLL
ncbi:MAG: hypothetical protein M0R21_09270 [Lentimicrobiaceae bacterium]|nr:hypothetical protein [Lentimicrobiaceae bacterium]